MPNDAKLGLVAGVTIVVLIAALFFRRDPTHADPPGVTASPKAAASDLPPPPLPRESAPLHGDLPPPPDFSQS